MSQRVSGYKRKPNDAYETPTWVTLALLPHLRIDSGIVYEPAAGSGKIVKALRKSGFKVIAHDITRGHDFLAHKRVKAEAIITNPPYGLAQEFIEHSISLMQAPRGLVAMLLRTDYDHAHTREHLFRNNRMFAHKIVLTKRIRWIVNSVGSPSFNHAWFVWDWRHRGPPTIAYGP